MNSPIVSTVIFDATSPAACPPIPSATMKSPSSLSKARESSLCLRLRPTSVKPKTSILARSSSFDGALCADVFERLPDFLRRRIPAHGFRKCLLGLDQKSRLAEHGPGVLQQADVLRLERDRGLESPHGNAEITRASGSEAEIVLGADVLRIAVHGQLKIAGGVRVLLILVGNDPLRDVVLGNRVGVEIPAARR